MFLYLYYSSIFFFLFSYLFLIKSNSENLKLPFNVKFIEVKVNFPFSFFISLSSALSFASAFYSPVPYFEISVSLIFLFFGGVMQVPLPYRFFDLSDPENPIKTRKLLYFSLYNFALDSLRLNFYPRAISSLILGNLLTLNFPFLEHFLYSICFLSFILLSPLLPFSNTNITNISLSKLSGFPKPIKK